MQNTLQGNRGNHEVGLNRDEEYEEKRIDNPLAREQSEGLPLRKESLVDRAHQDIVFFRRKIARSTMFSNTKYRREQALKLLERGVKEKERTGFDNALITAYEAGLYSGKAVFKSDDSFTRRFRRTQCKIRGKQLFFQVFDIISYVKENSVLKKQVHRLASEKVLSSRESQRKDRLKIKQFEERCRKVEQENQQLKDELRDIYKELKQQNENLKLNNKRLEQQNKGLKLNNENLKQQNENEKNMITCLRFLLQKETGLSVEEYLQKK